MVDPTPDTQKAMSTTAANMEGGVGVEGGVDKTQVKIEMGSTGMPKHTKLAHVLAVLVSGVLALCVSAVLADGTSVIRLKDVSQLKVVTAPELKSKGFDHRLDELLGPSYGIGLHHDQSGATWTEIGAGEELKYLIKQLGVEVIAAALPSVIATDSLKHPVPLLGFKDLKMAGLCAMSFGFIAMAVAILMIIFHSLALAGLLPAKVVKPIASLVWLTLTSGFLIVVLLGTGIYTATWEGNQPVIPTIKLSEHFDYSYGFAFANIGFVSSLLIFVVTLFFTSTKEGAAGGEVTLATFWKAGGALTTGLVLGAVGAIIVLGANGVYDAKPPIDPNVNPCEGQKPKSAGPNDHYFTNTQCMKDSVTMVLEQAGANITRGYKGLLDVGDRVPITKSYDQTDLCPVNVHWHLGAEHYSAGQFDEHGHGPADANSSSSYRRQLAGATRLGFRCHHYDSHDPKFTTPYAWKHCTNMVIGETYEVHWPHSAAGACGTKFQYQTPFYDGVFCNDGIIKIAPLNTYEKIGVQGQVFTIVNDESYYYPNLIDGMIVNNDHGADIAKYTGSTTGTSRDNQICSRYTPITWQVDRKCHMVSASSFDKMCADMLAMADDMSGDVYPHGSRELVADHLAANNQQNRKK